MANRITRDVRPKLWTGLALAGTAAGLAAAPAAAQVKGHVAPSPMKDAGLWLAQAEGGEGGEGAAPETARPGAAYLIELGKLEAHLLAAARLYEAGAKPDAVALAGHPEAEFLPELREKFEARGIPDLTPSVDALIEALATEIEVTASLDAALSAIRQAEASGGTEARDRYDAIVYLVRDAAGEYAHAVEAGKVVDLVALEESRGFLNAARALVDPATDGETGATVQKLLESGSVVFPDATAGGGFTPDPSILHGIAARIELAALKLR